MHLFFCIENVCAKDLTESPAVRHRQGESSNLYSHRLPARFWDDNHSMGWFSNLRFTHTNKPKTKTGEWLLDLAPGCMFQEVCVCMSRTPVSPGPHPAAPDANRKRIRFPVKHTRQDRKRPPVRDTYRWIWSSLGL